MHFYAQGFLFHIISHQFKILFFFQIISNKSKNSHFSSRKANLGECGGRSTKLKKWKFQKISKLKNQQSVAMAIHPHNSPMLDFTSNTGNAWFFMISKKLVHADFWSKISILRFELAKLLPPPMKSEEKHGPWHKPLDLTDLV